MILAGIAVLNWCGIYSDIITPIFRSARDTPELREFASIMPDDAFRNTTNMLRVLLERVDGEVGIEIQQSSLILSGFAAAGTILALITIFANLTAGTS